MNSKLLGLLAVGSMVGPITANAQSTTYTYQGDALPAGPYFNPPAGATSYNMPLGGVATLSGSVTLSDPLGDNLNDFSVTPTQIQMVSGGFGPVNGTVAFSTNGSGAIDGWSMSLAGSVARHGRAAEF